MRLALPLVVVLCSAAAFAQTAPPPPAGDKPSVQVKPRKAKAAPAMSQSMGTKLQACLDIDDGTKDRLNCYDAVIKPQPKEKSPVAKRVSDCKFTKEEDERLACFNGFVAKLPKAQKS